jgi:hypothetical protein
MNYLILLTAFLFVNTALAALGDEKGNGGDAVVCREASGRITSIEMFDYFEARTLRGMTVVLPGGESPENIASSALDVLNKFAPERVKQYKNTILEFGRHVRFVPGLVDVPDSGHIVLPKDCRIEQLIVQQTPQMPEDSRFLVAKELWDAMDDGQKAGALLHEAFYTEAIRAGHEDSRKARYFHTRMVEANAKAMTDRSYVELMEFVDYPFQEFREIKPYVEFWDGCKMSRLGFEFDSKGNATSLVPDGYNGRCGVDHPFLRGLFSSFVFNEDQATGIRSIGAADRDTEIRVKVHGQSMTFDRYANGAVILYSDGGLEFFKGPCYLDPGSKQYFCGDFFIFPSGVVRPKLLSDLDLPGWSFENVPNSTLVRNSGGVYVFSGQLEGISARYQKESLDLRFTSLEKLGIDYKSGHPVPLALGDAGAVPIAPESTVLGQQIGDRPRLYYMHDSVRGKNEYVQIGEDYLQVRVKNPLTIEVFGKSIKSTLWRRFRDQQLAIPDSSLSFAIQGKKLASQPNSEVKWQSKGVIFFQYKKGSPAIRLKGYESSYNVKGGQCVELWDGTDFVKNVWEERDCSY